jgi:hypothetical protein
MYRAAKKWKTMKNSRGKVMHYNPRNGRARDWSVADQRRAHAIAEKAELSGE